MTATMQKIRFIEYGLRMTEAPRRGEFRVGDEKSLRDTLSDFRRIAPLLDTQSGGEPSFREMMAIPEVTGFLSHFKERKLHFEFAAKMNSGKLQKAVIIADDDFRPLAIVRWVNGEGGAFFYHGLSDNQFEIDAVLSSVRS